MSDAGQDDHHRRDHAQRDRLDPDLIATQDLCQVCAPSGNELVAAVRTLTKRPEIVYLSPHTLDDIEANLREVGRITGTAARAEELIAASRTRRGAIASATRSITNRPR